MGPLSATIMPNFVLGFDVGATKTAWATIAEDGTKDDSGQFPTPRERAEFLAALRSIIETYPDIAAVGIGIAGTVSPDRRTSFVCTNIPNLSHLDIADFVEGEHGKPCVIDNDGRCALLGEQWLGVASDTTSAIMLTLGTGVGGAVMQRKTVLPHPTDVSLELSHLMVDQHDLFDAKSGRGTLESLLGGRNIENRYGISLAELSKDGHAGDAEALEVWELISHAFHHSIDVIIATYGSRMVIIGGTGYKDLDLYLGNAKPTVEVLAAKLGNEAGVFGAARLAWDAAREHAKDWDEE